MGRQVHWQKKMFLFFKPVTSKFMFHKAISVGSRPSELPQAVSIFLLLSVMFPVRICNRLSELRPLFKIPTYCLNHSRIFPTSHLVTISSNKILTEVLMKIRVFWYVTPYRLASSCQCFSGKQ